MHLDELRHQAVPIHDLYDDLNRHERGRVCTHEEFMLGFTGDLGDLAKLVMTQEGAREVPGGRAALEHELADCLWPVLILAHHYDVDLVEAGVRTRHEAFLQQQGGTRPAILTPSTPRSAPRMWRSGVTGGIC